MTVRCRRELGAVFGFVALTSVLFLNKPFHMDEPFFLAQARHIAVDPLHPFDFNFNWYGRSVPMASINNTPPLMLYALGAAWKLTGGREWAMRAFFVPFNLIAAAALYGLASVFLGEPLLPVLIVLAAPGYIITMNLLCPEKLMAAAGFLGLFFLAQALEKRRSRFFWVSAALCGVAVASKYGAVFLIPTAAFYAARRAVALRRIVGYVALSLAGIAGYIFYDLMTYHAALGSALTVLSQSAAMPYSSWPHKLRSILAFSGGGALVTATWPFWIYRHQVKTLLVLALATGILFLPALDIAHLVRGIDRLTGILLAFGALVGFWGLFAGVQRERGWALWAPWVAAVLFVQAFLYWSVLARLLMFLTPPLVFWMAEVLEQRWPAAVRRHFYAVSLVLVAALSAALAKVDAHYARAQKELAAEVAQRYAGRRLWCAGHWGLQYYLEQAGARELDWTRGGWDEVKPGDVVVVPWANSNVLRPQKKILANVGRLTIKEALPLRLLSAFGGEAGFYSNITGFLPFGLSREPLDEFEIIEVL